MEDERHNIEVALVDKELMHIVFGFLRFTDIASVSAVCRRWRMISALASETIVHIATTPEKYDRHHTLAVTASGAVYAFGDATDGKLGLGEGHTAGIVHTPQIVSALLREKIIKVGAAGAHSVALSDRGTVFSWGYGGNGRLGTRHASGGLVEPAEVQICIGSEDSVKPFIVDLWCGRAVTLLLDTEGVLYSFGVSSSWLWQPLISGSLGRPSSGPQSGEPLAVQFAAGVKIKSAAMGYNHGLAITTQGEVYSWGSGAYGRLGHGDEQDANEPRLISALASVKAAQVACGPEHSLVLTDDNTLYTFGRLPKGQLGYVEGAGAKVPCVVEEVAGLGVIRAISAAAGQSAVLFESGRVMGLGSELKCENWLVPAQLVAGEDSAFLVC